MTIEQAMSQRHTVRKYTDKIISQDIAEKLNERIAVHNKQLGLSIQLLLNHTDAITGIMKLLLTNGVHNYFILAGDDSDDLGEKLGYAGADIMLYAQTLGLNTWYVGGTYNRRVSKYVPGKKVIGIVALGYGKNNGSPHKSKTVEDVSTYDGEKPEWFQKGVEASLLAPTALNKQDYKIIGKGNKVRIIINNGAFTGANKGLIKYHFELGARKENFDWA